MSLFSIILEFDATSKAAPALLSQSASSAKRSRKALHVASDSVQRVLRRL